MQITHAELEIMNVLWVQPGIGASEIAEALKDDKSWNIRTIKTLVGRLVEKGALATEPDGRRYLYRPRIKRGDYQKRPRNSLSTACSVAGRPRLWRTSPMPEASARMTLPNSNSFWGS